MALWALQSSTRMRLSGNAKRRSLDARVTLSWLTIYIPRLSKLERYLNMAFQRHFFVSFRTAAGQMRSNWFCLVQNAFTQWKWRAFAEWALGYVPRKYDVRHQQGAGLERLLSRFASVCHGFWCWFMFTLWWRLDCWLIHAYLLWCARRPFGAHKVQVILDPPGRSSTQTTFPTQDGTDGNGWTVTMIRWLTMYRVLVRCCHAQEKERTLMRNRFTSIRSNCYTSCGSSWT